MMNFRFGSDNTGMIVGNFNLPYKISLQTQTMFEEPTGSEMPVMNLVSMSRDFRDSSLGFRYQGMP